MTEEYDLIHERVDDIPLLIEIMGKHNSWHITPLSSLQKQILAYLKLSPSLYKRLIENSS
jgi:hypothetical protein